MAKGPAWRRDDKRQMHEYRTLLNRLSDVNALKQECRLVRIAVTSLNRRSTYPGEKIHWAKIYCPCRVSNTTTVMSHETRVRPPGRLPFSPVRSVGSLEAGMPVKDNDRTIMWWHYAWLFCWEPAGRSGHVAPEHRPWLHICKYESRRCCNRDAGRPPHGQRYHRVSSRRMKQAVPKVSLHCEGLMQPEI